jgi:pyrroline-5-carboxylate reductase
MMRLATPVLMVGAGRMGGAMIAGWRRVGALGAADLILRDPSPGAEAERAATDGAALNGPDSDLGRARVVVLAVKPQAWRPIASSIAPWLAADATVISIMAGVPAADLAEVFPSRAIARAMPTTAAAVNRGAASLWSPDPRGLDIARALFSPLGATVDLADEALIHVATAASGSAPAYVYALVEALEAAAVGAGLPAEAARVLSRSALIGAAALLEASGETAGDLRRQVTSPGGTTEAALKVLTGDGALGDLMSRAVRAAAARSVELGAR